MMPRYWSIRPSIQGGLPTSAARTLGFVEQSGGGVDVASVDRQLGYLVASRATLVGVRELS